MKPKKIDGKLLLKKRTVANLNGRNMNGIRGGITGAACSVLYPCPYTDPELCPPTENTCTVGGETCDTCETCYSCGCTGDPTCTCGSDVVSIKPPCPCPCP